MPLFTSSSRFPRSARFALTALGALGTLYLLGACASDKGLPSDRPFELKDYRAEPSPEMAPMRNAADLVPTPTPSPTPTPWAPGR